MFFYQIHQKWTPLSWFQLYHKGNFSDWRHYVMKLTSHRGHFSDFYVILRWSVISACIYDVKTGFYDAIYFIGWCHFNKNAVTFLYGHKKRSSKSCNSLQSFVFCGNLVVMTYLRGFQLGRIFFQPERIGRVFNSGE